MITVAVFDKARKGKIMGILYLIIFIKSMYAYVCVQNVHTQTDGILIIKDAVISEWSWGQKESQDQPIQEELMKS